MNQPEDSIARAIADWTMTLVAAGVLIWIIFIWSNLR
jgi:hypothetical protein